MITKRWNDHKIAIWGVFLSKTTYFSHPARAYPPSIPALGPLISLVPRPALDPPATQLCGTNASHCTRGSPALDHVPPKNNSHPTLPHHDRTVLHQLCLPCPYSAFAHGQWRRGGEHAWRGVEEADGEGGGPGREGAREASSIVEEGAPRSELPTAPPSTCLRGGTLDLGSPLVAESSRGSRGDDNEVQGEAAPLLRRRSNFSRPQLLASSPCSSIGSRGIDLVRRRSVRARELCWISSAGDFCILRLSSLMNDRAPPKKEYK
jgi:hypothetical protein